MNRILACMAAAVSILIASCSGSRPGSIPKVDLTDNTPVDSDTPLFEVVEIVDAALTDSTMMGFPGVVGTDGKRLYLNDNDRFMLYDMTDSRCLASFCRRGEGPEEFITGWYVWTNPGGDGWTVLDVRRRKILTYSPEGGFISSRDNDSIKLLLPCGDGWVGESPFAEGQPKKYYLYTSDWQAKGEIVSPLTFRSMDGGNTLKETGFAIAGRETLIVENDTIYNLTPDGGFTPVLALDCGAAKMPEFKTFEEKRAKANDYLTYRVLATDSHFLVTAWLDGKATTRVIRRSDGAVVYCHTGAKDEAVATVDIDGRSMPVILQSYSDGKHLYLTVMADDMSEATGDDECNPMIVRARLRP